MRRYTKLPDLSTDRLVLRRPYLTDADDLYHCMKNENVCRYEAWHAHRSVLETLGFVNDLMNAIDEGERAEWIIVRRDDDTAIGVINLHELDERNGRAELGFWLGEPFWHNGYASEAARRVLRFAFDDMKLHRVSCLCVRENERSLSLIRRLGMSFEGTMRSAMLIKGAFADIDVFSLLETEYDGKLT